MQLRILTVGAAARLLKEVLKAHALVGHLTAFRSKGALPDLRPLDFLSS